MKRIVLCFDGTWNTAADDDLPDEQRVETNVRRFYRSVTHEAADGTAQLAWYNEGVGTYALNRLTGGAFGTGLDKHILDGYRHLVDTHEDGDEVYILGFSRGAYTARSLVGMIRNCGLIRPGLFSEARIMMAYGIYRTRDDGPESVAAVAFRNAFAKTLTIHFLGVWDTVGALGIPPAIAERISAVDKVNAALYEFHDTNLSSIVRSAYHAVALDEHRREYDVTLWNPVKKPGQKLEQRWFIGAHSDVGGGYLDRSLSDLALRWMQDRALEASLALTPVTLGPANHAGDITDSYRAFLKGVYAKRYPRHLRRVLETKFGNELVDASVDQRRRDPALAYQPANPGLPTLA